MIEGKNYIGNQWADSEVKFFKFNPSTEQIIGQFPLSDQDVVNRSVSVAKEAQNHWRKLSRIKRAEYFHNLLASLRNNFDKVIEAICLDTGKNFNEANAEFNESLHMAEYTIAQGREPYGTFISSEIAEKDIVSFRKPKGVVAVIAPFNFPLAIGGFWTSAPAILEGNTVVFKPSEDAPLTGQIIAKLYEEAGFPKGVFNLIHGKSDTGSYLVDSDVNHICFTGSFKVGQYIRKRCAETWKTCSCEMGSKSAVITFGDANLNMAVKASVASAFKLAGQRCVSSGRMIVQENIFQDFCDRFVEAAKNIKIGNPFNSSREYDRDVFYGPLINKQQFDRVQMYNEYTANKVGLLLEGKRIGDRGYFLSPHVYTCDWKYAHQKDEWNQYTHPFLREEVFGPHVSIIPFKDIDDAVRIYNDTEFGLSMAVITTNMTTARYMRENCDYGLGYHNLPSIGAESHANFGGVKKSGYGGSSAAGTFKTVTDEVTWTANFNPDNFEFCQGMK